MNLGFVLQQMNRAPRRVTNVRDDKIVTSLFWKPSFAQRRCLVPASSHCEPKGEKPATWHWFAINGDEPRPLFALPGIWMRYCGTLKKAGRASTGRYAPSWRRSMPGPEFGAAESFDKRLTIRGIRARRLRATRAPPCRNPCSASAKCGCTAPHRYPFFIDPIKTVLNE